MPRRGGKIVSCVLVSSSRLLEVRESRAIFADFSFSLKNWLVDVHL